MAALLAQLERRAKAVAALVLSGAATYVVDAVRDGQALTLHGLEAAAVVAALTALGVHQAPKNKEKPRKRTR